MNNRIDPPTHQPPAQSGSQPEAAVVEMDRLYHQAVSLHQGGQLDQAQALYLGMLASDPGHVGALSNLGTLHLQKGNTREGIRLLGLSLQIDPRQVNAAFNRGLALQGMGEIEEALHSYRQVLALQPEHIDALNNCGAVLQGLHRHDEALGYYDRALSLKPDVAQFHINRGTLLQIMGQTSNALASYDQALAYEPENFAVHCSRAEVLRLLDRRQEALASFDQALRLNPGSASTHNNRGVLLQELKRYAEALQSYDTAIELQPGSADAKNNRANALYYLQRYADALESYDQALGLKPDLAEAHCNKGVALRILARYDEALSHFDKAIAIRPDYGEAYRNKSELKLVLGDFQAGWALYEWRWKSYGLKYQVRSFEQPLWLGSEDLRGKTVLLHSEQGFGDVIQMIRYVPLVESLGAAVIIEAPTQQSVLIKTVSATARVVAAGDKLPRFDYHCPLMSLPLAFQTRVDSIPERVPYLSVDPLRRAHWRSRLGIRTRPQVGLVCSGRPDHPMDPLRSIPLAGFLPLFALDCDFHLLQVDIREADAKLLPHAGLETHFKEISDYADTAALVSAMDLVITVDTSVAHLAGSLGKPVWILLAFAPEFRWLTDREDSPWYPTARLFRQSSLGGWERVVNTVSAELEKALRLS